MATWLLSYYLDFYLFEVKLERTFVTTVRAQFYLFSVPALVLSRVNASLNISILLCTFSKIINYKPKNRLKLKLNFKLIVNWVALSITVVLVYDLDEQEGQERLI